MNPALSSQSPAVRRKGGARALFVAGTDTGVGKTVIVGFLGRHLTKIGHKVVTQKWIQTGAASFPQDLNTHIRMIGKKRADFRNHLSFMAPYIFKYPSSPHLASRLENTSIEIKKIKNCLNRLCADFDFVIVEGTGGLLVPLSRKRLLVDIIKKCDLPVLLVADNKLGAINHTLLSVEALKSRGIKIIGIIFNGAKRGGREQILKDNSLIVEEISGVDVLGVLPHVNKMSFLYRPIASMANKIIDRL